MAKNTSRHPCTTATCPRVNLLMTVFKIQNTIATSCPDSAESTRFPLLKGAGHGQVSSFECCNIGVENVHDAFFIICFVRLRVTVVSRTSNHGMPSGARSVWSEGPAKVPGATFECGLIQIVEKTPFMNCLSSIMNCTAPQGQDLRIVFIINSLRV